MGIFDVPIYVELKSKRVKAVVDHFGSDWFNGKKVLELGCGHADMGNEFYKLGAEVTVTDARENHLAVVRDKYPHLKRICHDLNRVNWPFERGYDLILNMGVLYHLQKFERLLKNCFLNCENMFIESIVVDSDDPRFVSYVKEESSTQDSDQSFTSVGCRPSWACIERIIEENGFTFERYFSKELNSVQNVFDWEPKNSLECGVGEGKDFFWLRRTWFCKK